ncbi:hypothetical protein HAX54_040608 [Datura stramonium]|uniref:Uncharacterized protein n=1 Tax=Datura stramonium TaxID=4076 RepID=A0ABS8VNI8_DATST|nr:hypothetical protein [Datura stramonium]
MIHDVFSYTMDRVEEVASSNLNAPSGLLGRLGELEISVPSNFSFQGQVEYEELVLQDPFFLTLPLASQGMLMMLMIHAGLRAQLPSQ